MKDIKQFVSRYAIFIFIVGVVTIIIVNSSISNLPSPFYLAPGAATREYYTPLRIYRFIRFLGIIITLVGAFFFVRNIAVADNKEDGKVNEITKVISESFSDLVSEIKQSPENSATSSNKKNANHLSTHSQRDQENVPVGVLTNNKNFSKSHVIQVKRQQTNAGMDYVYIDKHDNMIIGIHNILKNLTEQGYRIVNTIQTTTNDTEVIEIILEI